MLQKLRLALVRSARTLRLFLKSDVGRQAIAWFVLLIVLLLTINALNVVNSYVGRGFMTAISARQQGQYVYYAGLYLAVFAALTVVSVFYRFAEERLRRLWRAWLTGFLIKGYLSGLAYHRLKASEEIDHPDQRITEDVRAYTQMTLSFFLMTLNATITTVAFLEVLWLITPFLVLAAVAYAAAGTTATILMGRRLVRLNDLQLQKEANFRYDLIQAREASETIAVVGIERSVLARLGARLGEAMENLRSIIGVNRNLGFFTVGYNYLIQLIPLLIVAPMYMNGDVEFGVVTQSAMAFAQVLGAFSLIVTQFETLSAFAAVTDRLNTIKDVIERSSAPSAAPSMPVADDDDRVACEGLTLWTPTQRRVLVRDLSFALPAGRNLLIGGANGPARKALFLAVAGVWEDGEGRISRPHAGAIQFIPRQLYAVRGTLRERLQIIFPDRAFGDDQLHDVLRRVGLEEAVARVGGLDAEHDWGGAFSRGEQRLVALARVLLIRPRFVFLDQVTEGLGPDQVGLFYRLLSEASITYLSIGENHQLVPFHDEFLELDEDGRWRLVATKDVVGV
jgi:vitamin B12/bleomycin/antimicrobial peptide transport system ATP-binding/permease protein